VGTCLHWFALADSTWLDWMVACYEYGIRTVGGSSLVMNTKKQSKQAAGNVATYGGVAKAAGYPRHARQVVATLRSSVGLPWHRVLGSGGEIKLRGDYAVEQRLRLQAEGVLFRGRRVDLKRHEFRFPGTKRQKAGSRVRLSKSGKRR
jgi:alkylated DNA nucleotide flippase Atl1